MYALGRWVLGLGRLGAFTAASVLGLSGYLPGLMLFGLPDRMRWCAAPLLVALVADRRRPRASLVGAAVLYALVLLDGGLSAWSVAALLAMVWLLGLCRTGDDGRALDNRYAGRLIAVLVLAAGLALPKLVMMRFALDGHLEREPVGLSWPAVVFSLFVGLWLWGAGSGPWVRRRLGPRGRWAWPAALTAGAVVLVAAATLLTPSLIDSTSPPPPRDVGAQWRMMTAFRRLADYDLETGAWREQSWFTIAVGYGALAAAGFGAIAARSRSGRWVVLLGLALLVAVGQDLPFDLAVIVHHLPLLRMWDTDIAREFGQPMVLLSVSVLAGLGVNWLAARGRGRGAILAALLVAANIGYLIPQHWRGIREAYRWRTHDDPAVKDFFTIYLGTPGPAGTRTEARFADADQPWCTYWAKRGVAALPWDMRIKDPYWRDLKPRFWAARTATGDWVLAPDDSYPGEVWIAPPGRGAVRFSSPGGFSPNCIRLTADIRDTAAVIVINQRYDPCWVPSVGRTIQVQGLLGLHVPGPRRHVIALQYRPRRFYAALAASGVVLIVLIAWCLMPRVRRRREATAASSPSRSAPVDPKQSGTAEPPTPDRIGENGAGETDAVADGAAEIDR